MTRHPRALRLAAMLLAGMAAAAQAHDTWFAQEPAAGTLALGTGAHFPVHETPIDAPFLARQGCHADDGGALPLAALALHPRALQMAPAPGAAGCWVQTDAFELTLEPALIAAYLREVRPPPAVLAAWDAMRSRGLPWTERYTKHARIALAGTPTPPADPPLGLDALLESAADGRVVLRVLRDGQPLPDFAVELRHERATLGLWRRTDAEGRIAFVPTLAGPWLLRGIDLRPAAGQPVAWESRFVTLAFSAPQPPSSGTSNNRSTSHTAASTAISSEPPVITPRR